MRKLMIVPVGTSLFQSASWDKDKENFEKVLGADHEHYTNYWAVNEQGRGLHAPDYRKKHDGGLDERFKNLLTAQNADEWSQWLAKYTPDTTPVMRYSAELATILSFARIEFGQEWSQKLSDYTIVFIHDDHEKEPGFIAAVHLKAYLKKIIKGGIVTTKSIPAFSSVSAVDMEKSLLDYYALLHKVLEPDNELGQSFNHVDIITSGGYKIYTIASSRMLKDQRYRIIYQHEQSFEVIIQQGKFYRFGKRELFNPTPVG